MTYATLAGLLDRYGEAVIIGVTDRAEPPAGVVDQGVVDRALVGTDAVIDASLAMRYRLPLTQVPPVVADIALSIAIYKLHRFAVDQKIKDEYDQALKDLADIAAGRKKLDLAGLEPASSGAGGVVTTDRVRPLSADTMGGFI